MDETTRLEAEYCPPIDPALLFAIVSDFDLSTTNGKAGAQEILDQLKESALLEEAAEFDPSGVHSSSPSKDHATITSDEPGSAVTGDTSLTNGFSVQSVTDSTHTLDDEHDLEGHDEDTKILLLIDVFGEQVSEHAIKSALQRSKGNWNAAMEELLNQVYFNDAENSDTGEKLVAKGVDGFAEERVSRKSKRRRNRARRISGSTDSSASETSASSVPSKWQTAKNDVDFVSSRTNTVAAAVRLKYNQHGASVAQTINALLKEEMQNQKGADDVNTIQLAKELGNDFPTIAERYLLSLIRISSPSSANAHELAKALVARPASDTTVITPQYARPTHVDIDDSSWQAVGARVPTRGTAASVLEPESYAAARVQAFAQASAAHRRAKSDRLMGGAAAYYSQLGRDFSDMSITANATAADALAESQSAPGQVDLHGIDVLNGIRIAQEKTERWWAGLGENRANGRLGAGQRSEAFRIIVGKGTHSEGGKSKLGPAVTKMLRSGGWRFENEGAVIAVKGKQRA